MNELHAPVEAMRRLLEEGRLAARVSGVWGFLQFNPEIMVRFFFAEIGSLLSSPCLHVPDHLVLAVGGCQEAMPTQVVKALERCKDAFVAKDVNLVEREIQDFYLYQDDFLNFRKKQEEFEASIMAVEIKREALVAEEMARYDRLVRIEVEEEDWGWSPLFAEMMGGPQPPCLSRPYEHSEEEFQALLKWMEMEGKRMGDRNDPPLMARAMKLFARSEVGAKMPMLCPLGGLTGHTLLTRTDQIMFAMEELIRMGKIYFPTIDLQGEDFETFRCVLDQGDDVDGLQVKKFTTWSRDSFVRACLDTVALQQEDILRQMWVPREKVDKEGLVLVFRKGLLFRENIDLEYSLGSLEATGTWPAAGGQFYRAARELLKESKHHLHAKLQVWNITQDLEDLDQFRVSQVLCTIDQERVFGGGNHEFWKGLERMKSADDDGAWTSVNGGTAGGEGSPWDQLQSAIDLGAASGSEQDCERRVIDFGVESISCSPVVELPEV